MKLNVNNKPVSQKRKDEIKKKQQLQAKGVMLSQVDLLELVLELKQKVQSLETEVKALKKSK